jgi:hypothetical protein
MNGADIFVTNDKRLHSGTSLLATRGIQLMICAPEEALDYVSCYFARTVGAETLERVKAAAEDEGPVILGSNSCSGCSFIAVRGEENLATIEIRDDRLCIEARFRDENGQAIVELKHGQKPHFPVPGAAVTQVGEGPILVAEKPGAAATVTSDRKTHFAVRMTHTRRAVIYEMELRDQTGQSVVAVQKESLVLQGAKMTF